MAVFTTTANALTKVPSLFDFPLYSGALNQRGSVFWRYTDCDEATGRGTGQNGVHYRCRIAIAK